MLKCWVKNRGHRPQFYEIVKILDGWIRCTETMQEKKLQYRTYVFFISAKCAVLLLLMLSPFSSSVLFLVFLKAAGKLRSNKYKGNRCNSYTLNLQVLPQPQNRCKLLPVWGHRAKLHGYKCNYFYSLFYRSVNRLFLSLCSSLGYQLFWLVGWFNLAT